MFNSYFHLEKVDFMLKNEKGMTLLESLATATVIFTIVMTMIPLYRWIDVERHDLQDKRMYANQLYNDIMLQISEQNNSMDIPNNKKVEGATFLYAMRDNMLEGCVQWENSKQKREEICLYAK